jgi:hypothetical protein
MIANLALENNNLDVAGKYKVEAAKMRGVGRDEPMQVPSELLDRRPVLYTIDITALGGTKVNRNELAALIDHLEISERDRKRLNRDAQINDIPFELFDQKSESQTD